MGTYGRSLAGEASSRRVTVLCVALCHDGKIEMSTTRETVSDLPRDLIARSLFRSLVLADNRITEDPREIRA